MDWIRLGNSGKDLQGFKGKFHKVSVEELAQHNSVDDAWICLRGNWQGGDNGNTKNTENWLIWRAYDFSITSEIITS